MTKKESIPVIQEVIRRQLAAKVPETVTLLDGKWETKLTPVVQQLPVCCPDRTVSLDGTWKVVRWPFEIPEEKLVCPYTPDFGWETAQQPGRIFTQDPEIPPDAIENVDRVGLTHIDPDDGAVIRYTVKIPESWTDKEIWLRMDGIYPAGRVYCNGKLLGEQMTGLTPGHYNVTDLAEPGKEVLIAVRLLRRHAYVKMDMVRHAAEFCGLSQHGILFAVEKCHIVSYDLPVTLDESLTVGTVKGTVLIENTGNTECSGKLTLELTAPDGTYAANASAAFNLAADGKQEVPIELTVSNPALWNDEYPNLYTSVLKIEAEGFAAQKICWKAGFRRMEIRDGGYPYLNGNPVKFRGVNHLTYHPKGGMFTPKEWLYRNLELMKKANVNCIRTHFCGPRYLADICDELGIYLMQELPVDWGTNYIHDPEWVGPAMMRLHAAVLRDRHHPSIMVWSIGNENMPESKEVADYGYMHLRMYDAFVKTLDGTRFTMFPPPGPTNVIEGIFEVRVGDIADTHYSFKLAKSFLESGIVENPIAWTMDMETMTRQEAIDNGWSQAWFSSEYGIYDLQPDIMYAPYGCIICDMEVDKTAKVTSLQVFLDRLRDEWGFMRHEPTCLGGAYFPWMCSATGDNPFGWVVYAEDNDWGVMTAELLPKPQFWGLRTLFSPVWFPEEIEWVPGDTTLKFELWNQYNQIDLSECTIRTMMAYGTEANTRKWQDIPISLKPGEKKIVEIPIWNPRTLESLNDGNMTICRVTMIDPKGFRPITADIRIIPNQEKAVQKARPLAIGPDAIIEK